jgi:hypothetical protein
VLLLMALLGAGCYDFHLAGPSAPPEVSPPGLVNVTIIYRQPPGCLGGDHCDDKVVFFGSWMVPGTEFTLTRDPGNYVWRGLAFGVPVNFPPKGDAYEVRIHDPHLDESPTEGWTALNLTFGGEVLTTIQEPSNPSIHALVYVDQNGIGHNAF